jgi:NAD(P)H dehydrogenase (quinone)
MAVKMSETDVVLVTAAAGKTGKAAVAALRQRGLRVRALVRQLDDRSERLAALGAEVFQGDLLDFDSVSAAVAGVSSAYFCYPIAPGRLLDATAIFAQAASEAGVRAVLNMSQISARREAKSNSARHHWIAERMLDRTAMMTTHIRPTFFAEWLFRESSRGKAGWSRHDQTAVLRLPFGAGRHAPVAADDQGRLIAAILANPAHHQGQIYTLTGPVELSHDQIAAELSEALNISVNYEPIEISAFAEELNAAGYPSFQVQHLASVAQDYRDGIFAGTNNLIDVITGTRAMTVAEFATANPEAFAEPTTAESKPATAG